jgi:mannose-6-phosphate isomerase-like protein (cupin superfamily)
MTTTRPAAHATVQLDEPHVRVTEYRFPPGSATGWHRHEFDYVVVPIVPGTLTMVDAEGREARSTLEFARSYARRAGVEHDVVNDTDAEIAFIEIEMKR